MQSEKFDVVCFGEVLWDLLPSGALPGGAPMNVAYHLSKLGHHPALITRIGKDDYGKRLMELLSSRGLTTQYFQHDEKHTTGLVLAQPNAQNEVVYEISYPVAWDFIAWENGMKALLKQARYFVFGSLAARDKGSRATLDRLLEEAPIKILDINLRPPHFEKQGIEYLLAKADLLKVNNHELELIAGWYSAVDNMEDRLALLQERFDIKTIVVTMGKEGALAVHDGDIFRQAGFPVKVRDTIGSGDSFLAGFIHKISLGNSIPQALEFGNALAALVATHSGACPNYELSEIEALRTAAVR